MLLGNCTARAEAQRTLDIKREKCGEKILPLHSVGHRSPDGGLFFSVAAAANIDMQTTELRATFMVIEFIVVDSIHHNYRAQDTSGTRTDLNLHFLRMFVN